MAAPELPSRGLTPVWTPPVYTPAEWTQAVHWFVDNADDLVDPVVTALVREGDFERWPAIQALRRLSPFGPEGLDGRIYYSWEGFAAATKVWYSWRRKVKNQIRAQLRDRVENLITASVPAALASKRRLDPDDIAKALKSDGFRVRPWLWTRIRRQCEVTNLRIQATVRPEAFSRFRKRYAKRFGSISNRRARSGLRTSTPLQAGPVSKHDLQRMVELRRSGLSPDQVAQQLRRSPRAVSRWLRLAEAMGLVSGDPNPRLPKGRLVDTSQRSR